jgi:hypothetical protein
MKLPFEFNRNFIKKLLALIALSALLAWFSNDFKNVLAWPNFLIAVLAGSWILNWGWKLIAVEDVPSWLKRLLIGGALLRLALGAFWLLALPVWGYETPVQDAGYVMEDAFNRDQVAWRLDQSEDSLFESFRGYSARDQYGGLLFFSALIYRTIGAELHYPLLVIVFTASASAIAIGFLWALVKRLWGVEAAKIAAWALAIYPEAVLLGSSQMREAFGITFILGSIYALLRVKERRNIPSLMWLALGPILAAILSPPFALALIILLAMLALPVFDWKFFSKPKFWVPALIVGLAATLFLTAQNGNWLVEGAQWQAYVSRNASGWVARQFERMPLWAQVPFLLVYGVFRPLLPAAVFADGAVIWRVIAVWRALGWTILLATLFYASYLSIRTRTWMKIPGMLILVSWGYTLVSSYRGGGDLWDNPRYRSTFAGIQIAIAAWAWMQQRETKDPWLRRSIVGAGLMSVWWAPWYLRRYATFEWPIVEIQHVIGLGLASLVLYVIWDWVSA